MPLYCCVKVITQPALAATPFTSTITNINDARTGIPFSPHTAINITNQYILDTFGPGGLAGFVYSIGLGRNTTHGSASGIGETLDIGFLKTVNGYAAGRYSVCSYGGGLFFPHVADAGYFTSISAGTVELTWNAYESTNEPARMFLFLGGDDWNIDIDPASLNGVHPTTAEPKGILVLNQCGGYSTTLSGSGGAGSQDVGLGWGTNEGIYGCATVHNDGNDPGLNSRVQLTDRLGAVLDPASGGSITNGTPIVTNWGTNSYTITGQSGTSLPQATLAFSGANGVIIVCKAGEFTAPASDGDYLLDLGVDPLFIIFQSIGKAASSSVDEVQGSLAVGFTDRINLAGSWFGENTVFATSPPLNGSNYLTASHLIASASPNGVSTVLKNVMTMAPITDTYGFAHLTFSSTDGTQPSIIWFAVGIEVVPPHSPAAAGIYKMVDGRLNDKIYVDATFSTTALYKLPDPNAYTSLIGDE